MSAWRPVSRRRLNPEPTRIACNSSTRMSPRVRNMCANADLMVRWRIAGGTGCLDKKPGDVIVPAGDTAPVTIGPRGLIDGLRLGEMHCPPMPFEEDRQEDEANCHLRKWNGPRAAGSSPSCRVRVEARDAEADRADARRCSRSNGARAVLRTMPSPPFLISAVSTVFNGKQRNIQPTEA